MNCDVFLNSIIYRETGQVYTLPDNIVTGDTKNLGIIYTTPWSTIAPDGIAFILKSDGNWQEMTSIVHSPEPYSFVLCGIFYFGIMTDSLRTYYFTSKGVIINPYMFDRSQCEVRVLWEPFQPDFHLQISWYQFYISRVFLVGTNNKCYTWDYLENSFYATIYNPPLGKTFKHVWMSAMKVYCSTTENLLYQLGGNNNWIPIVNNQTVKSSISMNVDTITLAGKNVLFNSSPLLTVKNFVFEGVPTLNTWITPNVPDLRWIRGDLVPSNYTGGLNSAKLMVTGTDGDEKEWILYEWDITLAPRVLTPGFPDQKIEKKVDYFHDAGNQMEIDGIPLKWLKRDCYDLSAWRDLKFVLIYNSPITLST
jgi:hypothetical protein